MTKKRRHRSPSIEEDILASRHLPRSIDWWDKYDPIVLRKAQEQGRRLREEGYGAIEWKDVLGEK